MDEYWDNSSQSTASVNAINETAISTIDESLDQQANLEQEYATQTEADRLGFIPETGPLAIYQENDGQDEINDYAIPENTVADVLCGEKRNPYQEMMLRKD